MRSTKASTNTTTLILGITGGYGMTMASALAERGHTLRALVRDVERASRVIGALRGRVELIEGDVLDPSALAAAAQGCDVIVHGINAPYHKWDPFVVKAAEAIVDVAVEQRATIAFPGNVYAYAPGEGITEATPLAPPTTKGRLRVAVEAALKGATERGARLIVLRGGDFFGVGSASAWSAHLLKDAWKGGALTYPTSGEVRHQWAFLPDFARAHVELIEGRDALAPAAFFHFEGHVVTGDEWLRATRVALGAPDRSARRLSWWLLRGVGIFSPLMRALVEMRYLWDEEVIMDGARLREVITLEHTPLVEALRAELYALTPAKARSAELSAAA